MVKASDVMTHIYDLNPHLKPKPQAQEKKPKPVKKGRPKKEVKSNV
tara:strand:+ start:179 stop:316 length:138 start_codon:yes stop_codon:yes gene_type:complete